MSYKELWGLLQDWIISQRIHRNIDKVPSGKILAKLYISAHQELRGRRKVMGKEKTTLREIIRKMERIPDLTVVNLIFKDLKGLEKRIVKIIDKEELNKKHYTSGAAFGLSKGAIWACKEILGRKYHG